MGYDEPERWLRIAMLGGVGFVFLLVLTWFVLRRLAARLPDHSMAILLERRFGELNDSLLTTIEPRNA